jgi:aspartate aminotransferase-like enzyme
MALLKTVDPEGLEEFSVVFTDRSLNHMSQAFQQVMRDISTMLKEVYSAEAVALVPGGGTFAMEAVARQFAGGANVLVVRNGWFSYRWSQIFESGGFTASSTVMKARQTGNTVPAPFAPAPIEDVVAAIREQKPDIVFAPHVETSAGVILPDDYVTAMAAAAHEVGALMVLDCIASGCAWVDMKATGVDVLISAPQKGWSASPSAGLVMFSDAALAARRNHI